MSQTCNKEIRIFAEQYFSSHNDLNKKILDDIASVRNSFGSEAWDQMPPADRDMVSPLYFFLESNFCH